MFRLWFYLVLAIINLSAMATVIFTRGAYLSEIRTDLDSCMAQHETNVLGLVAFRWTRFNTDCANAKELLIMAQSNDPGIRAVAIKVWAKTNPTIKKYPDQFVATIMKSTSDPNLQCVLACAKETKTSSYARPGEPSQNPVQ